MIEHLTEDDWEKGLQLKFMGYVRCLRYVLPIMVKHTGYPEPIISKTYDFLVKSCIWDANTGLIPERVNFTSKLMEKVGNIEKGKAPTYDQIVDTANTPARLGIIRAIYAPDPSTLASFEELLARREKARKP